eukprot:GCRY01001636.1.p1 GENE.GCRY01001636.1~~GCRY01001636.1.p1  ORF type:complete len:704 (-),score=147.99 GCRY01001636.1:111-2222(-)
MVQEDLSEKERLLSEPQSSGGSYLERLSKSLLNEENPFDNNEPKHHHPPHAFDNFNPSGLNQLGIFAPMQATAPPPSVGQTGNHLVLLEQAEPTLSLGLNEDVLNAVNVNTELLIMAAAAGKPHSVFFYMMKGGDMKGFNKDGHSALHYAAMLPTDDTRVMDILLTYGVEVDCRNGMEETPLCWASVKGQLQNVHYLVTHGADLHAVDVDGRSPAHRAVEHGFVPVVHYLISKGLEVESTDYKKHTLLHIAAFCGQLEAVKYLIEHARARIDAVDIEENNAVHWAARGGHTAVVEYLHEHGGDCSATNHSHETAAMRAENNGHMELAQLIRQRYERPDTVLPPKNLIDSITPQMMKEWAMIALPIPAMIYLLSFGPYWWLTLFMLLGGMSMLVSAMDLTRKHWGPIGLWTGLFATDVLLYLLVLFPYHTAPLTHLLVWVLIPLTAWNYYLSVFGPKGAIEVTPGKQLEYWRMVEKGRLDHDMYCATCKIKRPVRSKHCRMCGECVSLFDHHCVWTNGCVGRDNHRPFVLFLTLQVIMQFLFIYLVFSYCWPTFSFVKKPLLFLDAIYQASPLLVTTAMFNFPIWLWVIALFTAQTRQVFSAALTNELINWQRYPYMHDLRNRMINPFNYGLVKNVRHFVSSSYVNTPEVYPDDPDFVQQVKELRERKFEIGEGCSSCSKKNSCKQKSHNRAAAPLSEVQVRNV